MNQDNQDLAKIVYTAGMLLQAFIRTCGMVAENKQRELEGKSMAYTQESFERVIQEQGVYHNSLIINLYQQG